MLPLSTDIRFGDEQAMLLETAVAFCRDKSPVAAVRRQIDTEHGFERALWDELVGLGWTGIAVPDAYGGSGLTLAEVTTIVEPMGRHLLTTPYVSTQLFTQALLAGGDEAARTTWLPRVCQGAIGTVALYEHHGDWNLEHIDTRAQRAGSDTNAQHDGDMLVLHGDKTLVCDAAVADVLLVSCMFDGAPALALVPAAHLPADRRRRETVIDETRRVYALHLDGLRVPAAGLIHGDAARAALRAVRDTALLLASAEAAGGIAAALDTVVDYLNLRTAFGRKIGSYQSLKHTCAEILMGLERSRSHVAHAATLMGAGDDAEVALRMAKTESGDDYVFAGDRAVQFHGGFGFTFECDAQLHLRRALWLQHCHGDAAHHRKRLGDLLLG
jgi:acyl-CoA dehydrogenase